MRCFRHRAEDALGVCWACGKAVCSQCAVDTGVGLACSEECVGPVKVTRALLYKSRATLSVAGRVYTVMGAIFAVPSGLFALMSLLAGDVANAIPWLPFTAMGILFIGWGRRIDGKKQASLPDGDKSALGDGTG